MPRVARSSNFPSHYAESGAVLEFPVGGPLHTHKTRSQDSETGVPEDDFGFR